MDRQQVVLEQNQRQEALVQPQQASLMLLSLWRVDLVEDSALLQPVAMDLMWVLQEALGHRAWRRWPRRQRSRQDGPAQCPYGEVSRG